MSEQNGKAKEYTAVGLGAEFERLVDERSRIQDALEKIEALKRTNGDKLLQSLNKVKQEHVACGKYVVVKMAGRVTRTIVKELLVANGVNPDVIASSTKVTEGSPFIMMRESAGG